MAKIIKEDKRLTTKSEPVHPFGQNIRALRQKAGLSMSDVQRQAGLSWATYRKAELGNTGRCNIGTIESIASVLGVNVGRIVKHG